jgi:cytochrome P450
MGQTHSLIVPLGVLLGLVLYLVYTQLYVPASHPRIAPGPASAHWFFGNLREGEPSELQPRLLTEYGPVVSFFGLANVRRSSLFRLCVAQSLQRSRLLTTDTRALAHILQHTDVYQKPSHTQRALAQMLGEGVQHRMQRKALNPAFGASQIRDLTGIMLDKANEVRRVVLLLVDWHSTPDLAPGRLIRARRLQGRP